MEPLLKLMIIVIDSPAQNYFQQKLYQIADFFLFQSSALEIIFSGNTAIVVRAQWVKQKSVHIFRLIVNPSLRWATPAPFSRKSAVT